MKTHTFSPFKLSVTAVVAAACLLLPACGGGGGGDSDSTEQGMAPPTLLPDDSSGNSSSSGSGSPTSRPASTTCVVAIPSFTDAGGNSYSVSFTCDATAAGDPAGAIASCSFAVTDSRGVSYSKTCTYGAWENNGENSGNRIVNLKFESSSNTVSSDAFSIQLIVNEMRISTRQNYDNGSPMLITGVLTNAETSINVTSTNMTLNSYFRLDSTTPVEIRYQ